MPRLLPKPSTRFIARRKGSSGTKVSKRKKKTPEAKLKARLWELCRLITEKRYANVCFTCGKPVFGSNRQLGHFIPSSVGGVALRYHLDNLRWQCFYDNITLGGFGAEFYLRLVKEIGQERVDILFRLKNESLKADKIFYENLIKEYNVILNSYGTN